MAGTSVVGNCILFIFVSLLLGFTGYEIKKKLSIPVSPILLILGIVIRDASPNMGTLGLAFKQIDSIDPHLILFAMMPALIFEAGISTDWYTFRKEFSQIAIMATTVVFLSALLTACTLVYILGYDFSWNEAFLLGVILSATDHVAVVAQLKEIYADDRFETLVQGETLLNEATVFVLFSVMMDSLTGAADFTHSISLFFRLSLGGLSLGLAFSLAFSFIIRRMVNDELQQTNLTIVTSYLLFYTADGTPVHVSGALAVVTFGLFMSAYGKTLISPSVEKYLHDFWKLVGTCMESLIFIMGGMLLGMHFVDSNNYLTASDIGMMVALFALLHFIRGASIFSHYPLLQNLGYGLDPKEGIVMTLSGLKGAISTALALIAYNEPLLDPKFKSIMLFFTTGICALTIVFDSILMKSAVKHFGMEALTEVQENMLVGVTTGILQHTSKKVEHLRNDKEFKLVRWDFVMKFAGPKRLLVQIMKGSKVGSKILKRHKDDTAEQLLNRYTKKFNLTSSALVDETRRRFFTTLKGIYWHTFESGHCMGMTSLKLINSCNKALDTEKNAMCDWDLLKTELFSPRMVKILTTSSKIPVIGKIFKKYLRKKIFIAYDSAFTFITAHEEAENIMDQMEIDIDEEVFKDVMEEAHEQVKKCKEFLYSNITDCYPDIIVELQTLKACKCLIISQQKLTKKIYEQGVIKELEYKYLISAVNNNSKKIKKVLKTHLPSLSEILQNRFTKAKPEEIEEYLPEIKENIFEPGTVLFSEGDHCSGAFLIMRGRIREHSSWVKQDLMIGNIVGAQHLLPEYSKNTSTATAITQVVVAHLPVQIFGNHHFFIDLFKEASEELLLLNKECFNLVGVKNEHLFRVVSHSTILHLMPGEKLDLSFGVLLLYGQISPGKRAYCFVWPKIKIIEVTHECVCLVLPDQLSTMIQQLDSLTQAFANYYIRSPAKSIKVSDKCKNSDLIGLNAIHKLQKLHTLSKIKIH
ncbi:hypothetical protein SteCoe_19682 [Stentor coeruleus]|uniref:Cyclic nucleotide-binding domain-containing protein n=1 Tax=Stentor coeruleus TaxID=5963 RepID=A0A1R2BTJ1_9CILI|nr:hypothetical protein SteCoe_19682 [Stentor coeruleus]